MDSLLGPNQKAYCCGTTVVSSEWIGTVLGLQGPLCSLKRKKIVGKIFLFSKRTSDIFYQWDWRHIGTLAGAFRIFLLFPLPAAPRERSFNKLKKAKFCMLCKMSRDLAILSAEKNVASSIYFSDDVKNFAIKFHFFVCSRMVLQPA